MVFQPEELCPDASPLVVEALPSAPWRPLYRHACAFDPADYTDIMLNLIKNPNLNTSWLVRADILHDDGHDTPDDLPCAAAPESGAGTETEAPAPAPPVPSFVGFACRRRIVSRLIPRNTKRDKPMVQTCVIYESLSPASSGSGQDDALHKTLVVYLPHVASAAEMPFYHPVVRAIAFLHEWDPAQSSGFVSISYLYFNQSDRSVDRLTRTAFQLLQVAQKHGQGRVDGYKMRVHHDVLIPQARVQNTHMALKHKYARRLIEGWAETTDPGKHVFEDLSIAAFLIELWADMYGQGPFPGFVDIGCGNGLLVYILNKEGFAGWGFDARSRKSWASYSTEVQLCTAGGPPQASLQQRVLLPPPASGQGLHEISSEGFSPELVHDGRFPRGTFIISNHADELTPWTPILATLSDCPFIAIPCCSHDLTGKRYRAPPPKDKTKSESAYASLVAWTADIARDCGWEVEQEMLRIPSTRNTGIVGRTRSADASSVDIQRIVDRYGGTAGYLETVIKLVKQAATSH